MYNDIYISDSYVSEETTTPTENTYKYVSDWAETHEETTATLTYNADVKIV